jgi:hypothetical protein
VPGRAPLRHASVAPTANEDIRTIATTDRRPALIATAVAVPITIVLAFLFTAGSSGPSNKTPSVSPSAPLGGVTVAAPPAPDAATQAACVKVFAELPVQLDGLDPRKTETDSSFVAAWGNPAIVIRCGVAKSTLLNTPQAAQPIDVNGVIWQPDPQQSRTVYTSVDRSVTVEVTVPAGQDQPLATLAPALKALPQVCTASDAAGNTTNPKLPSCH